MYDELRRAVALLAGLDADRVALLNGIGFNRLDSDFGHKLAELEAWTPRQAYAAWRMAAKYSGQLASVGIDYSAILQPEKDTATPQAHGSGRVVKVVSADGVQPVVLGLFSPYDPALIPAMRTVGRWCKPIESVKAWQVVVNESNAAAVIGFAEQNGFEVFNGALVVLEAAALRGTESVRGSMAETTDFNVDGLGGTLYPFQRAGVEYVVKHGGRALIADEPGLGKTMQALASLQTLKAFPALVVCPASVKLNWRAEAKRWIPGKLVTVVNGKTPASGADVTVINYDILQKRMDWLKQTVWKAIVLDESHYVKSRDAARSKAAKALAQTIPVRILLTGTPVLNRPVELIQQLDILGALQNMGGVWKFLNTYCAPVNNGFGTSYDGASNLDELQTKLRTHVMVRRLKAQVLKELPAKTYSNMPVALSNADEYERAEENTLAWIGQQATKNETFLASIADLTVPEQVLRMAQRAASAEARAVQAEGLTRIGALRQLAGQGKVQAVVDWVEDFLTSDQKLVLFAHHIAVQKALTAAFPGCATITGDQPVEERQANVDRFQSDDACRLIVCSLAAGGIGITLTAASNVAFIEYAWTPALMEQAADRVHRIGQANAVNVWRFVAEGTIDDYMIAVLEGKAAVIDQTTNANERLVSNWFAWLKNKQAKGA